MATKTVKYNEDDDDWGMYTQPPKPQRQRTFGNTALWRYRVLALVLLSALSFLYWTSGHKDKQEDDSVHIDWSRFAYVQYATDVHSMCNAYMVFDALHRLGSKADRVLLYPDEWNPEVDDVNDRSSQLLVRASQNYGVKLYPTQLLGLDGTMRAGTLDRPSSWEASTTKLRVFELEDYDRVLYFDSDVLLQQHLDELFTLPSAPIAMPRRYWSDESRWNQPLSGILMLIEPNVLETKTLWDRLQEWRLVPERAECRTYDDDLLDDRFRSSALVLPHRPYLLQTSEFRRKSHEEYLGTSGGPSNLPKWNPRAEMERAKIIHFNDWPLPKPWIMWPAEGVAEMQPTCTGSHDDNCDDRKVWKDVYDQFRQRRKDVCKILSVPAPVNWEGYKEHLGVL